MRSMDRIRPSLSDLLPTVKVLIHISALENNADNFYADLIDFVEHHMSALGKATGPWLHMLFLDGVYTTTSWGKCRFHRTNAPNPQELSDLVHTISHRLAGYLERQGILERDEENSSLTLNEGDEDPMRQVLGCSVSYRIAIGPQQGRIVFTLQTIPSWEDDDRFTFMPFGCRSSKCPGYSGHPALRPSGQLKLFKIVPDDFVSLHAAVTQ